MRVLVTGAKGQVGSELILEGEKYGLKMLAASRHELDITRRNAVNIYFEVQKPDIVINAAAYTAVDKAESEPDLAYATNRDGVANLARACADNGIPFLHISTDYVFDGNKKGAYIETDTPNPQCVYGESKLAGERAIESILDQYFILRVSWVFGANGNNFVKTMLRLAKERKLIKVVADQRGGPTPAGAIAATLLTLTKRWDNEEAIYWGTYHYSGQPATTWKEFAEVIFKQTEELGMIEKRPVVESISIDEYPTPAVRPLNSVLDCSKLDKQFYLNQPDWRIGLRQVLGAWQLE